MGKATPWLKYIEIAYKTETSSPFDKSFLFLEKNISIDVKIF